jgi:DNA replication protein DnaC
MPSPSFTAASKTDGSDSSPKNLSDPLDRLNEMLERLMQDAPSETPPTVHTEEFIAQLEEESLEKARRFPWSFRHFNDPELQAMFAATGRYAADLHLWPMAAQPRWLSLLGPSETGKTHLARRLWDFWVDHCQTRRVTRPCGDSTVSRRNGRFVRFAEVLDGVLGGHKPKGWIQTLCEADFLVLDDIGTETPTAASTDILYRLLDARAGSGLKPPLWTITTSNLSLQAISDRYDARLASRMRRQGSVIVELGDVKPFYDR